MSDRVTAAMSIPDDETFIVIRCLEDGVIRAVWNDDSHYEPVRDLISELAAEVKRLRERNKELALKVQAAEVENARTRDAVRPLTEVLAGVLANGGSVQAESLGVVVTVSVACPRKTLEKLQ